MTSSELIPFREWCRNNGFGVTTGYKILNSGQIAAVKIGKLTFIRRTDAEDWAKKLPQYKAPNALEV